MNDEPIYYVVPQVGRISTPTNDAGMVDLTCKGFSLVIGSDLILAPDDDRPDVLCAWDGSANLLAQLATTGHGVTILDLLPHAIASARALFPNYLLLTKD